MSNKKPSSKTKVNKSRPKVKLEPNQVIVNCLTPYDASALGEAIKDINVSFDGPPKRILGYTRYQVLSLLLHIPPEQQIPRPPPPRTTTPWAFTNNTVNVTMNVATTQTINGPF